MLVNAIIMGTQKGGTTALFAFLSRHPRISTARVKEVHFFDRDAAFETTPRYEPYHALFPVPEPGQVTLEATPIYMYWRAVRDRLHAYNPNVKMIFLLRRPWDRAYSHWEMEFSRGSESRGFEDALQHEREWQAQFPDLQHRVYSYLDRGFYARQLRPFMEVFPRSQMLFLTQDQLLREHRRTLNSVCHFLEIEPYAHDPEPELVQPTRKLEDLGAIAASTRDRLKSTYAATLPELADLTGLDLSEWI